MLNVFKQLHSTARVGVLYDQDSCAPSFLTSKYVVLLFLLGRYMTYTLCNISGVQACVYTYAWSTLALLAFSALLSNAVLQKQACEYAFMCTFAISL